MLKKIFTERYERDLKSITVNEDLKQQIASQLQVEQEVPVEQKASLFTLMRPLLGVAATALVIVLVVGIDAEQNVSAPLFFGEQVDDWLGRETAESGGGGGWTLSNSSGSGSGLSSTGGFLDSFSATTSLGSGSALSNEAMVESDSIGFSVGGSKDIDSFRTNIENGYLPLIDSITYEGLFYEYFFETGAAEECNELFCPSYAQAVSLDPLSGEEEYYLAVGLNSGMKESDFQRKKLNLVVVMDISGSMSSPFDQYYYDAYGNYIEAEGYTSDSKMQVANESVVGLLDHLNADDRLGVVLFNNGAHVAKPVRYIGETDMEALQGHILDISPSGGTDMSEGMEAASDLLREFEGVDADEYENRIIFITDAMPNRGETSKGGLFDMVEDNADDGIYTTFIGVGVDFQAELVESLTKVRGANYYSVHSSGEFNERMDEGFAYMVTPLVFDLELTLEAEGYDIENVYGSPEADKATGEILYVNTLFPSKTEGGETRGGLVLLKLTKTSENGEIRLSAKYEDRTGDAFSHSSEIEFEDVEAGSYDNTGIRKGILLSRYVDLIKNWIIDERGAVVYGREVDVTLDDEVGIVAPDDIPTGSQWEQTSVSLTVSEGYQGIFGLFSEHLEGEMYEIGDESLLQELDLLELLIDAETMDVDYLESGFFDDWNF